MSNATLKSLPSVQVMAVRTILPDPSQVGVLLGEAAAALTPNGIQPVAPPMTIFHDAEFKPTDLDVEVVIPVADTYPAVALGGERQLSARTLPAVELAACIVHTGSFETVPQSYAALGQWMETNGYQPSGPVREVYLSPPSGPDGLMIEIQFPVTKG